MLCPNCLRDIPDNSRDCSRCGVNFQRWASGKEEPRGRGKAAPGAKGAPSAAAPRRSRARAGWRRRAAVAAAAVVLGWLVWWGVAPAFERLTVGGTVVYVSSHEGNEELYCLTPESPRPRRLTHHPAADRSPSLSRDGRRVAFLSDRDGGESLYLVGVDGSGLVRVPAPGGRLSEPVWSPTGRELAFVSDADGLEGPAAPEVFLASADGRRVANLSNHAEASDTQPAWSPGGTRLAFVSDRDGRDRIYTVGSDGAGLAPLTSRAEPESAPAWSPDGRRIAFASEGDLYVASGDGSGLRRLTRAAQEKAFYAQPSWSPDLMRLAAFRWRPRGSGRSLELAVLRADGSGVEHAAPAEPGAAVWPDAGRLVFLGRPEVGRGWLAIRSYPGSPQVCLRSVRRAAHAWVRVLEGVTARLFALASWAPPVDPALTVLTESGAESLDWAPGQSH